MPAGYIRTPDDSQRSASDAAINDRFPGTHEGQLSAWIPIGPEREFGRYEDLKNIVSRNLEVAVDTYESGGDTLLHEHPDCEQTYYIVAGRAIITVGEERREVGVGGIAYIPPSTKHCFEVVGEDGLALMVISAYF